MIASPASARCLHQHRAWRDVPSCSIALAPMSANLDSSCAPKRVTIAGPAGSLEALLETPAGADGSRVAVICHPHPVYGGTMTNKVVHMLAKSFNERGVPARALQLSRRGRQRGRLRRRRRRDAGRARGARLGCAALARRSAVGWRVFRSAARSPCARPSRATRSAWSRSRRRFTGSQSIDAQLPRCPWLLVQGDQR